MDAAAFVAELASQNDSILSRLAPAQTLAAEAGGDLSPRNLLRIALKNELEASEIAAMWMPSARSADLKLALARQAGDEARHYRLIADRLRDLGDNLEGFDPIAQGYSPLFKFLSTLQTDVERVAAGQFTREAIALSRTFSSSNCANVPAMRLPQCCTAASSSPTNNIIISSVATSCDSSRSTTNRSGSRAMHRRAPSRWRKSFKAWPSSAPACITHPDADPEPRRTR